MSSFFPTFPNGDFAPLFRLLDDYDVHRQSSPPTNGRKGTSAIRAFQPRFDVREEKDTYQLHGELPGIDQKDVSIEFVDAQTLVIKGRTEREYHDSNAPGAIESGSDAKQITEGGENGHKAHKATVEDENTESNTTVAITNAKNGNGQVAAKKHAQPEFKYWVTERSVGEFHRSFSFPGRVDQDAVKASLKNGILSVVVPKSVAKEARKIAIE